MKITARQLKRLVEQLLKFNGESSSDWAHHDSWSTGRSNWGDSMKFSSGSELEGNREIAAASDTLAAGSARAELEEYMEFNFKMSLEDAVEAWLEDHFYGLDVSPGVIDMQRKFLMDVGRKRGLDKI